MGKIDALYTPEQTLTSFDATYFYEMPTEEKEKKSHEKQESLTAKSGRPRGS